MNAGSCYIPTTEPKEQTIEDVIPPEKLDAMQNYARELRRKFPHMKQNRIMKKVAEHFKVKLT
jgi:hypothetical protein